MCIHIVFQKLVFKLDLFGNRSPTPFYREEREESEDNAKIFDFIVNLVVVSPNETLDAILDQPFLKMVREELE